MNFCTKCENRLETSYTSDTIIHECYACSEIYPSTQYETVVYKREYKKEKRDYVSKILRNAAHMDDNIKSDKTCPKCGEENVKYVVRGDDMDRYFCCKQGHIWID